MVLDGKGMSGHLRGVEIEIGRLVASALSPDDDSNFCIYSIYFILFTKKCTWT
jgi:hypothetical protein